MRTKLMYALSALLMAASMLVTSCKENEEIQPEPPVNTYSITFDANGGEGAMEKLSADEGESITLTANSFTRTDYTFSGWNTKADGTGTSYADKAKVTLSANLTLYAQWVADSKTVSVTGITLDKTTLTLKPNDMVESLVVSITPADATNKKVVWSSNNENVVCVDNADGTILTSDEEGTATITATTEDGGFTATCEVTVEAPFTFADDAMIFVEGVSGAAPESYTLNLSSSATLYFAKYWNRERYDYPSAKWSSSDPSVVSVSKAIGENGSGAVIKALKAGNSTIIAEDSKGNKLTLDISVTVPDKINFELIGGDNFNMIYVEGGSFVMGATVEQERADPNEFPAHKVTLSSYFLAEFEVTQRLWTAVMGTSIWDQMDMTENNYGIDGSGASYPMYYINYSECVEFADKLNNLLKDKLPQGYRFSLPSEAQWEYAARGGKKAKNTLYPGGDDFLEVSWNNENSRHSTHPVGTKLPNELGIYDMAGNVNEWCVDWYSDSYYSSSPENNPVNLSSESTRVGRGGSWGSDDWYCRIACRKCEEPSYRSNYYGMRVALVQAQ